MHVLRNRNTDGLARLVDALAVFFADAAELREFKMRTPSALAEAQRVLDEHREEQKKKGAKKPDVTVEEIIFKAVELMTAKDDDNDR